MGEGGVGKSCLIKRYCEEKVRAASVLTAGDSARCTWREAERGEKPSRHADGPGARRNLTLTRTPRVYLLVSPPSLYHGIFPRLASTSA